MPEDGADTNPALTHHHLRVDAVAALTAYEPVDGVQRQLREEYLAFLAEHPDGMAKSGPPAHLTASCLVLDSSRTRVLLTLHRKAGRWFQFGGHLEATDPSVWSGAQREGREESGLAGLDAHPGIVELNRHRLTGSFGRCREHLDVRFMAVAPPDASPQASEESEDVAWWPVDALPDGPGSDLAGLVRAALARP